VTVEHAYQAAKSMDPQVRRKIQGAGSPGEAKRLGRNVILRSDWDEIKLSVMEDLLRQKFGSKNIGMSAMLLRTGTLELIEGNTWGDVYWGVCNGKGENHLGKLLMKIRQELQG
jgi:ribA/ribD-fused uncharacterized protein